MSVLSSTNSGINTNLTEKLLLSLGYSLIETVSENLFYNSKDANICIKHRAGVFYFNFTKGMSSKKLEDRPLKGEKIILSLLKDVKLLEDWWFQKDIKAKRNLENKLLLLKEVVENDSKFTWMDVSKDFYSYKDYEDYEYTDDKKSYFKSPLRNYKYW